MYAHVHKNIYLYIYIYRYVCVCVSHSQLFLHYLLAHWGLSRYHELDASPAHGDSSFVGIAGYANMLTNARTDAWFELDHILSLEHLIIETKTQKIGSSWGLRILNGKTLEWWSLNRPKYDPSGSLVVQQVLWFYEPWQHPSKTTPYFGLQCQQSSLQTSKAPRTWCWEGLLLLWGPARWFLSPREPVGASPSMAEPAGLGNCSQRRFLRKQGELHRWLQMIWNQIWNFYSGFILTSET